MKIIYIVMIVTLSGCYQSVTSNDWELGTYFCKSKNSEILSVESNFLGGERFICKNLESRLSR